MRKTADSQVENSYSRHKNHLNIFSHMHNKFDYHWQENGSYDTWRHLRMYGLVDPLIGRNESWLTIGDGRYGSDAHYLLKKGVSKVLVSDISTELLKRAKRAKYISSYKEINAEAILLSNESYDYVFCKESFHHFPRPILALYEMIRVAKKGVILIEPNDSRSLKNHKFVNGFETVGNYMYTVSLREIEKITNAINLPGFAYKGLDDVYISRGGDLPCNSRKLLILRAKFILIVMDILYKLGLRERCLICVMIFKEAPHRRTQKKLKDAGYKIIFNTPNPYLGKKQ